MQYILELPFPPSVNHYWQTTRSGRVFISKTGRLFRQEVIKRVQERGFPKLEGRLRVVAHLHVPDKRERDADNYAKALYDALQHAGLYERDSRIKDQRAILCDPVPGGMVRLMIEVMK